MIKKENYPSFCDVGQHKSLYVARKGYAFTEEDGQTRKITCYTCSECDSDYSLTGGEGLLEIRIRYLMDERAKLTNITIK